MPPDASPALREALKELADRLDRLGSSTTQNADLKGKRFMNAGKAELMAEYTTLLQVLDLLRTARTEIEQAQVKARADMLAQLASAAETTPAPAALGDLPTWLAGIFSSVR